MGLFFGVARNSSERLGMSRKSFGRLVRELVDSLQSRSEPFRAAPSCYPLSAPDADIQRRGLFYFSELSDASDCFGATRSVS